MGIAALFGRRFNYGLRLVLGVILLLLGLFDSMMLLVMWGLHPLLAVTVFLNWLVTILLSLALLFGLTDKGGLAENPGDNLQRGGLRRTLARLLLPLGIFAILLGIWDYVADALMIAWG